ncbi:hypothetical protein AB1N83_014305 [Pleurotus pulmonarius]
MGRQISEKPQNPSFQKSQSAGTDCPPRTITRTRDRVMAWLIRDMHHGVRTATSAYFPPQCPPPALAPAAPPCLCAPWWPNQMHYFIVANGEDFSRGMIKTLLNVFTEGSSPISFTSTHTACTMLQVQHGLARRADLWTRREDSWQLGNYPIATSKLDHL